MPTSVIQGLKPQQLSILRLSSQAAVADSFNAAGTGLRVSQIRTESGRLRTRRELAFPSRAEP